MLETLPDPNDSVDVKMAARAEAQLLQRRWDSALVRGRMKSCYLYRKIRPCTKTRQSKYTLCMYKAKQIVYPQLLYVITYQKFESHD